MTRVYLDEPLRTKLLNLEQPLELCDQAGRVLGSFMPAPPRQYPEPKLSEEELQRIEQEPDYSTEEVLAYLEKL